MTSFTDPDSVEDMNTAAESEFIEFTHKIRSYLKYCLLKLVLNVIQNLEHRKGHLLPGAYKDKRNSTKLTRISMGFETF